MQNLVNVFNFLRTVAGLGVSDENGQGLVEYVLIIALVALVIVGATASGVTDGITGVFGDIGTALGGTTD